MNNKNTLVRNCMDCMHSEFDESVGEYKCNARSHYIIEPDIEAVACDEYECEDETVDIMEEEK